MVCSDQISDAELDSRIARAIKANKPDIAVAIMANHDSQYPTSKLRSIPQEERTRWVESAVDYIARSIEQDQTVTWSYSYYPNIMGSFDPDAPPFIEISNYYENILPMEDCMLPVIWREFTGDEDVLLRTVRRFRHHILKFIDVNVDKLLREITKQTERSIEAARQRERTRMQCEFADSIGDLAASLKEKVIVAYDCILNGNTDEALALLTATKLFISDIAERTVSADASFGTMPKNASANVTQHDTEQNAGMHANDTAGSACDLQDIDSTDDMFTTSSCRTDGTLPSPPSKATKREIEVLKRVSEGKSNAEIAEELGLSMGTIKNYTSSLLEKLQVENRTQLAVYAVKNGLI